MSESPDPSNHVTPLIPPAMVAILQDRLVSLDGSISEGVEGTEMLQARVVPLMNMKAALTGEWLLDLLMKSAWIGGQPGFRLCGPALAPAPAGVLAALGRFDNYLEIKRSTRFEAVAAVATARPHAAICEAAGKLRFIAAKADVRIAILPQHATESFALANRASLAAWLRAKRFTLIDPETMAFDALAQVMAAASLVVIADPRQAGLLPLCSPATKIIDIAPSGWRRATGQALSALFGLSWSPCEAGPPSYKLLTPLPFGARVPLAYEIPIGDLAKLLQMLG